jgi:hypothetical protein
LVVTIDSPEHNRLAHKLKVIRAAGSIEPIYIDEVIFGEWVPVGSFGTVAIYKEEEMIYSEQKPIPHQEYLQEGAQFINQVIGFQPFKHEIDVWARISLDDQGLCSLECHMGNPGTDQRKAVFEIKFNTKV